MPTLDAQHKTLANGRRLIRAANWVLVIAVIVMLLGLTAMLIGIRKGWLDNDDATPAVIGLVILSLLLITFFGFSWTGRRLIGRSIADVIAAGSNGELPAILRIGPGRTWLNSSALAGFIAFAVAGFAVVGASPSDWLCPGLIVALLAAQFIWLGPAGLGAYSARFDATGITLPELGIRVPWGSVSSIIAKESGVRITIGGELLPSGSLPRIWTDRSIRRISRDGKVELPTYRQDEVVWYFARQRSSSNEDGR